MTMDKNVTLTSSKLKNNWIKYWKMLIIVVNSSNVFYNQAYILFILYISPIYMSCWKFYLCLIPWKIEIDTTIVLNCIVVSLFQWRLHITKWTGHSWGSIKKISINITLFYKLFFCFKYLEFYLNLYLFGNHEFITEDAASKRSTAEASGTATFQDDLDKHK